MHEDPELRKVQQVSTEVVRPKPERWSF